MLNKSLEYAEGYQARLDGKDREDNPHKIIYDDGDNALITSNNRNYYWDCGWNMADYEERRK